MYSTTKMVLCIIVLWAAICEIQALEQQQHQQYHNQQQQHQQQHLQCWHCSSETIGAENFCGTTFDEDAIPTDLIKERNISLLRSCNSTINSEHERAVCRKTVEEFNGKTITKRFCYYTNKSDTLEHCNVSSIEKNVRRLFCEDCLSDKCNSGTQLVAMLGVIIIPLAIAKVFAI